MDIGANLLSSMYAGFYRNRHLHDADMDQVMMRARNASVEQVIVTIGSSKDFKYAKNLFRYDNVRFTAGIHPSNACEWSQHTK